MKKKTTIGDLASMTQRGFTEMSGRFDLVDKRLDDHSERMRGMENRLDAIEIELLDIRLEW